MQLITSNLENYSNYISLIRVPTYHSKEQSLPLQTHLRNLLKYLQQNLHQYPIWQKLTPSPVTQIPSPPLSMMNPYKTLHPFPLHASSYITTSVCPLPHKTHHQKTPLLINNMPHSPLRNNKAGTTETTTGEPMGTTPGTNRRLF